MTPNTQLKQKNEADSLIRSYRICAGSAAALAVLSFLSSLLDTRFLSPDRLIVYFVLLSALEIASAVLVRRRYQLALLLTAIGAFVIGVFQVFTPYTPFEGFNEILWSGHFQVLDIVQFICFMSICIRGICGCVLTLACLFFAAEPLIPALSVHKKKIKAVVLSILLALYTLKTVIGGCYFGCLFSKILQPEDDISNVQYFVICYALLSVVNAIAQISLLGLAFMAHGERQPQNGRVFSAYEGAESRRRFPGLILIGSFIAAFGGVILTAGVSLFETSDSARDLFAVGGLIIEVAPLVFGAAVVLLTLGMQQIFLQAKAQTRQELLAAQESAKEFWNRVKQRGGADRKKACPVCGAMIADQLPFCPYCGAMTATPPGKAKKQADPAAVCGACGFALRPGEMFCPHCGRPAR